MKKNIELSPKYFRIKNLSDIEYKLLDLIGLFKDDSGLTIDIVSEASGKSEKQVIRILKVLIKKGYIVKIGKSWKKSFFKLDIDHKENIKRGE